MYNYFYATDALSSTLLLSIGQLLASSLFSIATYVMTSLALYTIAKRRGLHNPWLAWIPVANCWLVGSISDQYRYVAHGQTKAKRKWLLGLQITMIVLLVIMVALFVYIVIQAAMSSLSYYDEEEILHSMMGSLIIMLALLVPMLGVSIAYSIISYMSLYDIYKSLDPSNCVLYLVLSILIPVTQPFFLLCNRNKDLGMPPRRPEPAQPTYIPPYQDPTNFQ